MARPKKQPGEGRTAILQIRLTADEKELIEAAAHAHSLDVSAWVRMEILARARHTTEPKGRVKPKPQSPRTQS